LKKRSFATKKTGSTSFSPYQYKNFIAKLAQIYNPVLVINSGKEFLFKLQNHKLPNFKLPNPKQKTKKSPA
jgi:hypothetical protein